MINDERYKILIVDDERGILDLINVVLRRWYTVFRAESGAEALEIIEKEDLALVLTDHWMEGITGIEILEKLHTDKPDVGRLLISGLPDLHVIKQAINKGHIHRFITKPWEVDELRQIVAEEIGRYDAVIQKKKLMQDLVLKNQEMAVANEEIMSQKHRLQDLNREYKEQSQIAIELSEKFATAHLELLDAQEEIKLKNEQLEQVNRKLEKLSITDGLTGFFNRRHLEELLDQEIGRALRYNLHLSCMMVDLDKFKAVNDTWGHLFGDQVLKTTATIVQRNIRDTDLPTRYGGDEFFVILPHSDIAQAKPLALRIVEDLADFPFVPAKGQSHNQLSSIGIATLDPHQINTKERLMESVDSAMYRAKREGSGPIFVFEKPIG